MTRRVAYPAGWFTEPMRLHNFPPGFVSQTGDVDPAIEMAKRSRKQREIAAKTGNGWGNGTILMPGTPKRDAPGDMRKPHHGKLGARHQARRAP